MLLRIIQLGGGRLYRGAFMLALASVATLCVLWSIPALVGSRLIWPHVLARLTQDIDATVRSDDVTLGWFAPIELRGVRLEDLAGERVATAGVIRSESTLFSLLLSGHDLGTIVIDELDLQVRLRPRGSNIEDILSTYLKQTEPSSPATGTIALNDARITVFAPANVGRAPAHLTALQATIALEGGEGRAGQLEIASCQMSSADAQGSLAGSISWRSEQDATHWSMTTDTQSFDLGLLECVAQRLESTIRAQGIVDVQGQASWVSGRDRLRIQLTRAEARDVSISAPQYLGSDRVALARVVARGGCSISGSRWQLKAVDIRCTAGHIALDGDFVWPGRGSELGLAQLMAILKAANLRAEGRIDLAQLAATLPRTLRVREDVQIESGTLEFTFGGAGQSDARHWTAHVEASELAARREGRRFTWGSPLKLTVKADATDTGWEIEQLICASSCLSLRGGGHSEAGFLVMQCDLRELCHQLSEFIQLGSFRARGSMSTRLDWKRQSAGQVKVHGTSLLENLELDGAMTGHWQEPRLSATLSAIIDRDADQNTGLRMAQLELASSTDRLEAQLLEPVDALHADAVWMIGCQVSGQWTTWFPRLSTLLPHELASHQWRVIGPVDGRLTMQLTRQSLELQEATLNCEPFWLDAPAIRIDEPAMAIDVSGTWEFDAGRLRVPEATFQSAALAFRVNDLRRDTDAGKQRTTGDITFRVDFDRLYEAWRIRSKQHDWRLGGSAQGQISLVQSPDVLQSRWKLDLVGLAVQRRQQTPPARNVIPATHTPNWATVWREPILKFTGGANYRPSSETVELERFELNSADKLQLSVRGSLSEPVGPCHVNLEGQITYDLAKLLHQWVPELEPHLRWIGQGTQPLRLTGPLFHAPEAGQSTASIGMIPTTLAGETSVSWQSADILGIAIGPGAVTPKLAGGKVRTGPVELPVSGGMMHIEPTLHLNHQPPLLSLAPGLLFDQVQLTAGMCDRWLKYAAPVVADATRAEGMFSASLANATIPLREPQHCQLEGTLQVHDATIGPGPLARRLIQSAQQLKALLGVRGSDLDGLEQKRWVRFAPQQTRFRVADRRVYHERLVFEAADVEIHTRGSVGFDQTLSLVALIPIQPDWLQDTPQLAALRGQMIQLPISGTLEDPRIDQRALERVATDTLRRATGALLENELRQGLQRWLDPDR